MNYPVWDVPFGSQWLIAVVAVVHVFVSHFAIGGGLMLVVLEGRAHRQDDPALLEWLERYSRFFVYLTLVVGAVTGVGIWFTVGLISPEAISTLIHVFLWIWAIEWVFFAVEILSILVYASTWDRLPRRAHRMVGWIYFVSAYLSLVAVDGILAYQIAPGRWLETHRLVDGFFNPNFLPSLLARTLLCLILGGAVALLSLSRSKDRTLKAEAGRLAAAWVWVPALAMAPVLWWFLRSIPADQRVLLATSPILVHVMRGLAVTGALLVLVSFLAVWLRPRSLGRPVAAALVVLGLLSVGLLEWAREDLRLPYLVGGYLYANDVPVRQVPSLKEKGLVASSAWMSVKKITPGTEDRAGGELFRALCSGCHRPVRGANALVPRFAGLDTPFVAALVAKTRFLRGGMPPFPGKPEDAHAIARYLMAKAPPTPVSNDGAAVWQRRCAPCHTVKGPFRPVAEALSGQSAADLADLIRDIDSMNDKMPPWTGNDVERQGLAEYLARECAGPAGRPKK